MYILNFAHPITEEQLQEIRTILGSDISQIIEIPSFIDSSKPLEPQIEEIINRCQISSEDWQKAPFLINLPSLSSSAAALLAHLHGLMGYFPPILRIIPVDGALPPRFSVAEIVNLQALREKARHLR